MRQYVRDEDGNMCDRRDFLSHLSRYCADCGEDLGDYCYTGTVCDDCAARENLLDALADQAMAMEERLHQAARVQADINMLEALFEGGAA